MNIFILDENIENARRRCLDKRTDKWEFIYYNKLEGIEG